MKTLTPEDFKFKYSKISGLITWIFKDDKAEIKIFIRSNHIEVWLRRKKDGFKANDYLFYKNYSSGDDEIREETLRKMLDDIFEKVNELYENFSLPPIAKA